jgi:hypothetical protein
MKICALTAVAVLLLLAGCGTSNPASPAVAAKRAYSGTASVGDFLSITLDSNAQTITYTNHSNGDSGTVPYTVNSNGTYTLNDPNGNLISAYEVPNYALLINAAKTGPNHDTPALITAVEQAPITVSSIAGHQFNYMQFRTNSGGVQAGSVDLDAQGNVTTSSYWPYGATPNMNEPFDSSKFASSSFTEDPSGTFLTVNEGAGVSDYAFGTPNGVFAVDTQNGAILAFQKAATMNFDPTVAGTYKAIYYQKLGGSMNAQNQESGTPSLGNATATIDASANLTITNSQGAVMVQAVLTPVAATPYLYGSQGQLQDPCYGLFTYRVVNGGATQDVFVTFVNGAMLFSSFLSESKTGSGYDYFYGVGLK